jgi:ribokinase
MNPPIVYNLGSLNIDRVFRVPHIVAPGETLAARSLAVFAGGKGANQSVALARAGAHVVHIGKIGSDGLWLRDKLAAEGVDTERILIGDSPTGQAIIQVDDAGQNSILLLAGANAEITPAEIDRALADADPGSWLLVQNETSGIAHALQAASDRGLHVALNPAPFDDRVSEYPIQLVDLLCVNETEATRLRGVHRQPYPDCEILLTLGAAGAVLRSSQEELRVPGCAVNAVDSTAAGDTFLGYFLAARLRGLTATECLNLANHAAALCVTRPGAMDSIPHSAELEQQP